jgi:hypothetical protein
MEAFLDLAEQASRDMGHEPYDFPDSGDLAADLKAVLRAAKDAPPPDCRATRTRSTTASLGPSLLLPRSDLPPTPRVKP